MIVDELISVLGYDIKGEANLKRFNAGLERAHALAQRLATALVAAGTIAGAAMAAFGKSVIETSAKFEGFQTSLETIEGSAEKAKAAMDWVSKFAAHTPYELDGVTEAFIKLRAYGFDPMDGTLKTLGDTASAMNKPLMQAVEAFADAATFEFERLKEFGIKSAQKGDQVTFRWQQNGKEMTKTVKKNGKEVTKFLIDTFGNRFNNAMERQSKTWNGMMSNLGDTWDDFKRRVGAAGFFDAAKKRLKSVLDYIERLDKNGSLDRWAKGLSSAFESAMDGVGVVFDRIKKAVTQVSAFLSDNADIFGPLKWALAALMFIAFPTAGAIAAVALAVDDLLTYLRGGESVIGAFIAKLGEIMPSLKDIPGQLKALDFHAVGKSLGTAIVDGLSGIGAAIAEKLGEVDWAQVFRLWAGAIKAQIEFFTGIFNGIGEAIGKALVAGLTSVGQEIKAWFQSLLPEWATEFFNFRDSQTKGMIDKATEAGDRRRQMENLTTPYNPNLKLPEVFKNYQANSARAGGGMSGENTTVNAPVSTVVHMTVKMEQAATAAANAVREKVSSALSTVPSHPTRVTKSPTF